MNDAAGGAKCQAGLSDAGSSVARSRFTAPMVQTARGEDVDGPDSTSSEVVMTSGATDEPARVRSVERRVSGSGAAEGVWLVLLAAGSGARFGGAKQFAHLGERRVIDVSLRSAMDCCAGVVVVGPAPWPTDQPEFLRGPRLAVVEGGSTRSDSVRAGLAAVPEDARWVLVHDCARPLASRSLYFALIDSLRDGSQAVVPVVPVADSLITVSGETVDRSLLLAVQTPQGFERGVLARAHAGVGVSTDDASLVRELGIPVRTIPGEPTNFKITTAADLELASCLVDKCV